MLADEKKSAQRVLQHQVQETWDSFAQILTGDLDRHEITLRKPGDTAARESHLVMGILTPSVTRHGAACRAWGVHGRGSPACCLASRELLAGAKPGGVVVPGAHG